MLRCWNGILSLTSVKHHDFSALPVIEKSKEGFKKMFSIEGKFFGALTRFSDLVILNILFLICCVPVITIGASITALYSVTNKMAEDKENYIVKSFFRAFKENLRQSTIMWLILLIPEVIISIDLYIGNFIAIGLPQTLFKGFMLLAMLLVFFVML